MDSGDAKVIFITCLILQILGNIVWSYRDDVMCIFIGKKECTYFENVNPDFSIYSVQVNKLAIYIDRLKEIRKLSDELESDFYFKDRFIKSIDDEISYAEGKLNQAVGKEVLKKNKEVTP